MKTLTIPQLHEVSKSLQSTDLILDVRTPGEFAAGHIPKAKNIPVDQVMNHVTELMQYKNVYIYCRSGGRVSTAWSILDSLGLNNMVCVDDGGYPDWADAGFPSEK
jgi:rhodanese-related sulfurtransferase